MHYSLTHVTTHTNESVRWINDLSHYDKCQAMNEKDDA